MTRITSGWEFSPRIAPPNYYRLLNVEVFESDLDVIEGAADKQMGFVRQYQSGEHASDAAKILNELATARLCLLKPATKSAYDAKLRQHLAPPADEQPEFLDVNLNEEGISRKRKKKASKQPVDQGLMIKAGVGTFVVIVGIMILASRGKSTVENPASSINVRESNAPKPMNSEPTNSEVVSSEPVSPVKSKLPTNPIGDELTQKTPLQNPSVEAIETTTPKKAPMVVDVKPAQPSDTTPPVDPARDPASKAVPDIEKQAARSVQDKIGIELDSAVAAYEKEKEGIRESILGVLDRREATARKAGDKKGVDQAAAEREEFKCWNVLPPSIPATVIKRRVDARAAMEIAFNTAIKSYTKANQDDAATGIEKERRLFRGEDWRHLNLEAANLNADAFQMPKNTAVFTTAEYSGPIEIHVIARTEKNNIRLHANRGSSVIFNWEVNPKELRVTRPDGRDQLETGSLAALPVTPLKPGVWYRLRWRIANDGMAVFVNDKPVFSESKANDLTKPSKIVMTAGDSVIEVRDFHVVTLPTP